MAADALTIGKRIKAARHAADVTQKALASAMGVPQSRVSGWERDQGRPPSYSQRGDLAAILGVAPEKFDPIAVVDPFYDPDFFRVSEAARKLAVSESMIYKLLNNGTLPSTTIGRRRLIPVAAVEALRDKALAS